MTTKIRFFSNGNVVAFKNLEQMPDIQRQSWFVLYLEWLIMQGYKLEDLEFTLPDGQRATPFATDNGYNWSIG